MLIIYVRAGGDLNKAKCHYTNLGYTYTRTITQCGCDDGKNHRETMIFTSADSSNEVSVVRCITCSQKQLKEEIQW